MSVADGIGCDPETVLRMPFHRFLAYERMLGRRDIEARNREARAKFEADRGS